MHRDDPRPNRTSVELQSRLSDLSLQTRLDRAYPYALGLASVLVGERLFGAPYLSVAQWVRRFWSWPSAQRQAWQRQQLRRVLLLAQQDVDHYRDRIVATVAEADPFAALADLGTVGKASLLADPEAFTSRRLDQIPVIRKHSNGSTGQPLHYPLDKAAWAQIFGSTVYVYERNGYRYGEKICALGAPIPLLTGERRPTVKSRIRHAVERRDYSLAGVDIAPEKSLWRVVEAGHKRANLWYGYPSVISAMAHAALEHHVRITGPNLIVTTGEPLLPHWRDRISTAFGSRIIDEYGSNDGGLMSHSCDRGRFHVADNLAIIEVLDDQDRPCPPGVEGHVVATHLHATAMPFLRYRIGDRAALGKGLCPCGREGTTLERFHGRVVDILQLADGAQISPIALGLPFLGAPHVRRWQVVQTAPNTVTIRLDVRPGFDDKQEADLRRALAGIFSPAIDVRIVTDQPFAQTAAGKHRFVVREL